MRKREATVEVYFLTDPLCPWSWAMERILATLRADTSVSVRTVLACWMPSLAARGRDAAKKEWADAAATTGAPIDPSYWDRDGPETSLVAMAAVKAAGLQGVEKGEAYLRAVRHAAFQGGADISNVDVLARLAETAGLREDLFRGDLGAGRYSVVDVLASLDPSQPLSESVAWFGRRRMLRSWEALARDLRSAERQGLGSPALHILAGRREAQVKGFATETQIRKAIASVR